jgi:hypothetical protein
MEDEGILIQNKKRIIEEEYLIRGSLENLTGKKWMMCVDSTNSSRKVLSNFLNLELMQTGDHLWLVHGEFFVVFKLILKQSSQ